MTALTQRSLSAEAGYSPSNAFALMLLTLFYALLRPYEVGIHVALTAIKIFKLLTFMLDSTVE